MSHCIGKYEYVYGAGNAPNRSLQFYGNGEKVWAEISGKRKGVWAKIGEITETSMTKEGASTTDKILIMMNARNASPPSDKTFDEIPYSERVEVIQNLEPSGTYRITIYNNIEGTSHFETAESLIFFDPS